MSVCGVCAETKPNNSRKIIIKMMEQQQQQQQQKEKVKRTSYRIPRNGETSFNFKALHFILFHFGILNFFSRVEIASATSAKKCWAACMCELVLSHIWSRNANLRVNTRNRCTSHVCELYHSIVSFSSPLRPLPRFRIRAFQFLNRMPHTIGLCAAECATFTVVTHMMMTQWYYQLHWRNCSLPFSTFQIIKFSDIENAKRNMKCLAAFDIYLWWCAHGHRHTGVWQWQQQHTNICFRKIFAVDFGLLWACRCVEKERGRETQKYRIRTDLKRLEQKTNRISGRVFCMCEFVDKFRSVQSDNT